MNIRVSERIPVRNGEGVIVERVTLESARGRSLAAAPNAELVRKRKGEVVSINLRSSGDESDTPRLRAHPFKYSHNHENETNPENVWTLRHIPTDTADIFGAVVNQLAKAA